MRKLLFVVGIVLIIAAFTNPDKQKHVQAVKDLFADKLTKAMADGVATASNNWEIAGSTIGMTLGLTFIDRLLENLIYTRNYVFFSLTEVRYQGESRIIGIGAFGNVWILNEVENLVDK